MSAPESDEVLQLDLDPVERTVVQELSRWLGANEHAEWKQSPRLRLVEQCSDAALRTIVKQLMEGFIVVYFRTSYSGWALEEGELILISPSEGCAVRDGDQLYPLGNGKKVCFSKNISVEVPRGVVAYLVWKVKKSSP